MIHLHLSDPVMDQPGLHAEFDKWFHFHFKDIVQNGIDHGKIKIGAWSGT